MTGAHLSATDEDSDDASLIFTLASLPSNGELKKDGAALAVGATFTQADITAGKIRYAHDGTLTTSDSFDFTVTDPEGNSTDVETFSIRVVTVVINEVDADTPGADMAEFIELYDGGLGNTPLDGLALVFYNGQGDVSYRAIGLDGHATNAAGQNAYQLPPAAAVGRRGAVTQPGNERQERNTK